MLIGITSEYLDTSIPITLKYNKIKNYSSYGFVAHDGLTVSCKRFK